MNTHSSIRFAPFFLFLLGFLSCENEATVHVGEEGSVKTLPGDWMYLQRAYPNNDFDHSLYRKAFEQTLKAKALSVNRGPGEWKQAGPVNIGGRITDLALHPSNMQVIYAGTSEGGLFKSSDGGDTWQSVFENIGSNSVGAVALAPSSPETIYLGTGEANGSFISGAFFGDGVYKSNDGGQNWQHLGLEQTHHIGRIVVDPNDAERVFVAAAGILYGKNEERGLYRTTDGGNTWEKILYLSDSTACIDVAMNPLNPDILYAATWERIRMPWGRRYGGVTSGIYRSFDGGDSWEQLTNGLPPSNASTGRIGLYISPSEPNVIFSVYTTNPVTNQFNGIYRSDDAGTSWYRIDDGEINNVFASFGWFFGNIRVSPVNSEDIWCLGVPLMRSKDNGNDWSLYSATMHVDFHALEIHPLDPSFIVAGNDGGIYISHDDGVEWSHVQTLPISMFYTCEIDYLQPERLYGGTQDNGTLRTLTGELDDWGRILGGDGFHVIVDPTDNEVLYAEYQYGTLFRSLDGGDTLNFIFNGNPGDRTNWNTPVVLDPSDSKIIYYGANLVYRSTDRGDTWQAISPDLTDGLHPNGNLAFGTITTLSVSPADGQTVYAGTDDGNVQVTFDGGLTWNNISSGLPDRYVTQVAAHPEDPMQAFVTLSGFRQIDYQPHVLYTQDGGNTWEDRSGNLPEIPVNDIIIHPEYPEFLFIANDMGVWYTTDQGENWEILGSNLPLSIVTDLDLHAPSNTLVAATFGRSMFTYDISEINPVAIEETKQDLPTLSVYPNPVSDYATINLSIPVAARAKVLVLDTGGKLMAKLADQAFGAGRYQFTLHTQSFPAGQYILVLETDKGIWNHKLVKI